MTSQPIQLDMDDDSFSSSTSGGYSSSEGLSAKKEDNKGGGTSVINMSELPSPTNPGMLVSNQQDHQAQRNDDVKPDSGAITEVSRSALAVSKPEQPSAVTVACFMGTNYCFFKCVDTLKSVCIEVGLGLKEYVCYVWFCFWNMLERFFKRQEQICQGARDTPADVFRSCNVMYQTWFTLPLSAYRLPCFGIYIQQCSLVSWIVSLSLYAYFFCYLGMTSFPRTNMDPTCFEGIYFFLPEKDVLSWVNHWQEYADNKCLTCWGASKVGIHNRACPCVDDRGYVLPCEYACEGCQCNQDYLDYNYPMLRKSAVKLKCVLGQDNAAQGMFMENMGAEEIRTWEMRPIQSEILGCDDCVDEKVRKGRRPTLAEGLSSDADVGTNELANAATLVYEPTRISPPS